MKPLLVTLICLAAIPVAVQSATLRVPEQFATIQLAVDQAAPGDTVDVGPGSWTGSQHQVWQSCGQTQSSRVGVLLPAGVSLVSREGPSATVISVQGEPALAISVYGDGTGTTIEGFTVLSDHGVLFHGCFDSDLLVRDCVFRDSPHQLPFELGNGADTRFEHCEFSNLGQGSLSVLSFSGGGGESLEVVGCRFYNNVGKSIVGWDSPSRVYIDDCDFLDNNGQRPVSVVGCPNVTVRNSRFSRNSHHGSNQRGGAIKLDNSSSLVEFCTFAYDSSLSHGGILGVSYGGSATVRNNTFYRGHSHDTLVGSALVIEGESDVLVQNNVVVGGNSPALAVWGPGTVSAGSGCNLLWDNTGNLYSWDGNYYAWDPAAMATDILADPQFCAPEDLDFTVSGSSPALGLNSPQCGPIGAHGEGCGAVSVESSTWGRIKSAYRKGEHHD